MKQQQIARHQSECVNVDKERERINAKIKRIVMKKCRLQQEQVILMFYHETRPVVYTSFSFH